MEIRMAALAEFHKSGAKEPFLWNRAAAAAGRNRKAVDLSDIIAGSRPSQAFREFPA